MGRKKEYITELSKKDARLAQCFYYSKTIKQEDVLRIIAKNRLGNYIKQGLVQKCSYKERNFDKVSKDDAYRLTDIGYSFFKKNYPDTFADSKKYGGTSAVHDLALAKEITKLTDAELRSVQSELDCRDRLKEYIEKLRETDISKSEELRQQLQEHTISPPDCVYIRESDGQAVCIEIVTQYYTQEMIEAKQEFCAIFNIEYQQTRI
ncbi:hypothetical protein LGK97_08250 [Clostridium sp. CS001]|uniref:hypothetical protein n=1 Tax=Clostridium sp. CS001 TaxID=2880648 RepID=UPI001CF1FB21|nr:hypothetical protein [Clostridium sp. CS001]MCB2289755.1 hypothetical protein [Clostridium sp. CS001]